MVVRLVLDGAALVHVSFVLKDKLPVDPIIGRVSTSNSNIPCPLAVEYVVVLTLGGSCACQPFAFDLWNLLLPPGDDVLFRVHLIPDIFRMFEGLKILVMSIGLLGQIFIQSVIDGCLLLASFHISFPGDVHVGYC